MDSAPTIVFALEKFATVFDDALPMLEQHYEELTFYKSLKLNPDRERYEMVDAGGLLRIYTARDCGSLIGYGAFIVSRSVHYRDSIHANEDAFYLSPSHRGRTVGMRFLKWCDEQLIAEGVQIITHHVKLAHPTLGMLLEKIGYDKQEWIYSKKVF